jgi:hypothetical protein
MKTTNGTKKLLRNKHRQKVQRSDTHNKWGRYFEQNRRKGTGETTASREMEKRKRTEQDGSNKVVFVCFGYVF